ncbi:MAG: antitoxin Xre/MbcA/ParS toxin-binding domain-containing protein [Verrucomicrobiales bacterium]
MPWKSSPPRARRERDLKPINPGTGRESPLSYAGTEFGTLEVENLLGRLDHGIF